ncbi:MAG: exosortase/archaeosortase family protein [Planctomycetes bacterium]|nr:exosortase/archaeosortase family protein [Planctomycetota bacterium]
MSAKTATKPSRLAVAWAGVLGALCALLFGETFLQLVEQWWTDPNYSHGFLVLPFSIGLAWHCARRTPWTGQGEIGPGLAALFTGCGMHLVAVVLSSPLVDFVALALVLRGLTVLAGGRTWASAFTFPILFLFFLFPLPGLWTATAAVWLQDIVSRLSATILDLFLVCYRRGNTLYLAGLSQPLVVAEECSGLRQIVAFVALGALLGHLSGRRWYFRLLLLFAAVPVAIVANLVRVLLMAFGAHFFGTGWIAGSLHHAPALFSMPLGIALYLLVWWGLLRVFEPGGKEKPIHEKGDIHHFGPQNDECPLFRRMRVGVARILANAATRLMLASCCLTVAVVAQWGLKQHLSGHESAEDITLRRSLADLPLTLGSGTHEEWRGQEHPARQALAKQVAFADEYIYRVYQARGGPAVSLYAVWSSLGADRKHHPEVCVRDVAGAPEDTSARKIVFLDREQQRPVQRFRFRTGTGTYTVIYYWHYTLNPAPPEGETALQAVHRRLGRTPPSVTVQVSTSAAAEELERVERSFLPALDEALQRAQLPATVAVGCDRVPVTVLRP